MYIYTSVNFILSYVKIFRRYSFLEFWKYIWNKSNKTRLVCQRSPQCVWKNVLILWLSDFQNFENLHQGPCNFCLDMRHSRDSWRWVLKYGMFLFLMVLFWKYEMLWTFLRFFAFPFGLGTSLSVVADELIQLWYFKKLRQVFWVPFWI